MNVRLIERWGARLRERFDHVPARLGAVTIVGVLAAGTAITGGLQSRSLEQGCGPLPVKLIRLEVTFSPARFGSMLDAEGACAANVVRSFVTWDLAFPLFYGPLLAALYLWVTRWRRFDATDSPLENGTSLRHDLIALAPIVAAVLDLVFENLPLWLAGTALAQSRGPGRIVTVAVLVGSAAALVKWLLLLLSVGASVAELGSGPRGSVLWRVRFSTLAVLLGGVPLLAIPQGQDILQRLFEGDHPAWRLAAAVPPILLGTLAIWYCARKILELRLPNTPAPPPEPSWHGFFAEQIPRALGIGFLALVGMAFARAGLSLGPYVGVVAAVFFVALLLRRFLPSTVAAIGRPLVPKAWRGVPAFDQRVGRLVIAALLGLPTLWIGTPHASLMPADSKADDYTIFYLRFAAYLCFIAGWVFQLYVRFRRAASAQVTAAPGVPHGHVPARWPAFNSAEVTPGLVRGVIVAAIFSFCWLAAFTMAPVQVGRAIGPLVVLALAASNAVFFGTISVWLGKRLRIPFVTCAVLSAFLFSLWNDGHTIRTMPQADGLPARRPLSAEMRDWVKDLPDVGAIPVVLVAGSGGGLRAAYWTAISLAVLQDQIPSFGRHMFAFSGVSGGSLGGAVFASLLRDSSGPLAPCPAPPYESPLARADGPYASCVRQFMRDDHLSPVLAKLVAPDFLQLFLPFPMRWFDRSIALEASWEQSYEQLKQIPTLTSGFASFPRPPTKDFAVPLLFLNATHVETGRRYITSVAQRRDDPKGTDATFQDAGDVLGVLKKDLPMSTALHNSARFTYISPAGHLDLGDGKEHGHLVDAGYFENSGLATLREIYDVISTDQTIGRALDLYVLYLCNDPVGCGDGSSRTDSVRSTAADELLSPVRALLKTRDARGSLARQSLIELAGPDHFLELNVCRELAPHADAGQVDKARERVVRPPLGWLLSKLARDWMDASLVGGRAANDRSKCSETNEATIATLTRVLPKAR